MLQRANCIVLEGVKIGSKTQLPNIDSALRDQGGPSIHSPIFLGGSQITARDNLAADARFSTPETAHADAKAIEPTAIQGETHCPP